PDSTTHHSSTPSLHDALPICDSTVMASHHPAMHKVQDPYSLRCVPQVHGAVADALDHLRRVIDVEMNSATDNPLVFPEGRVADEDRKSTRLNSSHQIISYAVF